MSDPFLVIGVIGMICILYAFLMVQMHTWTQDELRYDLINLVGAGLLLVYAIDGRMWPFVILNGIWLLYSLIDVLRDYAKRL